MKFLLKILKLFLAVFITIYFAVKVSVQSVYSKDKQRYRRNATRWGSAILKVYGLRVKLIGIDKLKRDETYILASNHSSLFDIPILFYSLSSLNYVIIYKKELEKIPLFGRSLIVSPFISIDRKDARNAMASIELTLEQMKDNDCPIIFPEGTRSEDGKLQEFKRGAFLIASRSGKPIVPITIIGSAEILPKGSLNAQMKSVKISGNEIKVIADDPIVNEGKTDRISEKELMLKVYGIIKMNIDKYS